MLSFGLGRIPKGEGNHERWRRHDGESHPVENVGRKLPVECLEGHNATLSRTTSVAESWLARILGSKVANFSGGKVEISTLERLQNSSVRDISVRCNPLPFNV